MPEPLLVGDVFRNAARAVPDRVAVVIGAQALTFGQLDRMSNSSAQCFARSGLEPGARVVVGADVSLETAVLFAGFGRKR